MTRTRDRNRTRRSTAFRLLCALCALFSAAPGWAQQQAPVTAKVELVSGGPGYRGGLGGAPDASNVVLWLTPAEGRRSIPAGSQPGRAPQVVQQKKSFEPHVLVIEVGSMVEFPNHDPFFHNVFSLYNGKRFDLGLYEAGSSRSVQFVRPGVSFLFCNIHPEMSAVVVAVDTPYFGLSDRTGRVSVPDVPDGRYQMHVWHERSLPEDLKPLERMVVISESTRSLGSIPVTEKRDFKLAHKNKYGQDYVPPAATSQY